jgi:hypothetical protein
VYRVRGAVIGENLTPIGEYSSIFKNLYKCMTIYRLVLLKGEVLLHSTHDFQEEPCHWTDFPGRRMWGGGGRMKKWASKSNIYFWKIQGHIRSNFKVIISDILVTRCVPMISGKRE